MTPATSLRRRMSSSIAVLSAGLLGLSLTACSKSSVPATALVPVAGAAIHGLVHGGQQPVKGSTVQIYAVGSGGDGSASTTLLTSAVATDSLGNFNVTGKYSCPSADALVYIVSTGGDPGMGANNPNLAEMAALGPCGSLTASTYITINEVSTVAAVFELAPYMTSYSHVGYGTDLAGITAAFAEVNVLVDLASGRAGGGGVPAGMAVPVEEINTLADILAACVNSTGGMAGDGTICGKLLSYTGVSGQGDLIAAMLQIARNPSLNAAGLYSLISPNSPFQPVLTSAPGTWGIQPLPLAATPVFSLAPGTYTGEQTLSMTTTSPGTNIYYTTDGSTPTIASTLYTGTLTLDNADTVFTAIAAGNNYATSTAATGEYVITGVPASDVLFNPEGGAFANPFSVTLSATRSGTTIYYTTDGTQPTTSSAVYNGPITVSQTERISAIAVKNGLGADSVYYQNYKLAVPETPGIITTVAGGTTLSSGAPTSAAQLIPSSVVFDHSGNEYVSDVSAGDGVVRKVDPYTGAVTTMVDQNTFVAGYGGLRFGAAGALAVNASGDLYIVDLNQAVVWLLPSGSSTLTEVAGYNQSGLGSFVPNGLAVDAQGNLYISDVGTNTVRKSDGSNLTLVAGAPGAFSSDPTQVGDGGPATSAVLAHPAGLAFDAAGDLYIADSNNARVRMVDASTHTISTVAGTGVAAYPQLGITLGDGGLATAANLGQPNSIALDSAGNLYILDWLNMVVRKVDATTKMIRPVAGNYADGFSGDGGLAIHAEMEPTTTTGGLTFDGDGNLYIVDEGNLRMRMVTPGGAPSTVTAPPFISNQSPVISADAFGNYVVSGPISLLLSSPTTQAAIYYTLDGSTPTTSSTQYSGAVTLSASATIKAIAVSPGYTASSVASQVFTLYFKVATPIISASGSSAASDPRTVTISTTNTYGAPQTPDATIYYTLDGSTPTRASTVYTGPFTVSTSTGVHAIAVKSGYQDSDVSTDAVELGSIQVAPVFSIPAGTYTSVVSVSLSTASSNTAYIYYTTDGSNPVVTPEELYTGPISVSSTTTIRAIAGGNGSYHTSSVSSATYVINLPPAATPVLSKAGGTFSVPQAISMSTTTSGAKIYYTLNGGMPTANDLLYTGPITFSSSTNVQAVAIASGYSVSAPAQATYIINLLPAAAPVFSVASGSYSSVQNVSMTSATSGAVIYYTTDGTLPTTSSSVYTGPVSVSTAETLEAFAVSAATTPSSVTSATYTVTIVPGQGTITKVVGSGTGTGPYNCGTSGTATTCNLGAGARLATDGVGNFYVAESARIDEVDPYGTLTKIYSAPTTTHGLARDVNGNFYYMSNRSLYKVSSTGTATQLTGSNITSGSISFPYADGNYASKAVVWDDNGADIAVTKTGGVYVLETIHNDVRLIGPGPANFNGNLEITTVAGLDYDSPSSIGDPDTAANHTVLSNPHGIALDSAGNLYIADTGNNVVRMVTPAGAISIIAGNGTQGYSGDTGVSTDAMLNSPYGVAVDSKGNVYIADYGNHRVRKVTPGHVITTVAGNGTPTPTNASNGVTGDEGDGGAAPSATLFYPQAVAVDSSDNLLIGESDYQIRKVTFP